MPLKDEGGVVGVDGGGGIGGADMVGRLVGIPGPPGGGEPNGIRFPRERGIRFDGIDGSDGAEVGCEVTPALAAGLPGSVLIFSMSADICFFCSSTD